MDRYSRAKNTRRDALNTPSRGVRNPILSEINTDRPSSSGLMLFLLRWKRHWRQSKMMPFRRQCVFSPFIMFNNLADLFFLNSSLTNMGWVRRALLTTQQITERDRTRTFFIINLERLSMSFIFIVNVIESDSLLLHYLWYTRLKRRYFWTEAKSREFGFRKCDAQICRTCRHLDVCLAKHSKHLGCELIHPSDKDQSWK